MSRLPAAYTDACGSDGCARRGGVGGKNVDRAAVEDYLRAGRPSETRSLAFAKRREKIGGLRGQYLVGLALCLETMWDLAMEILGKGEPVPYERCVEASTGRPPEPSKPEAKRERVAELLSRAGYPPQARQACWEQSMPGVGTAWFRWRR